MVVDSIQSVIQTNVGWSNWIVTRDAPAKQSNNTLQGTNITYPTKRESQKGIDSNVPTGLGYVTLSIQTPPEKIFGPQKHTSNTKPQEVFGCLGLVPRRVTLFQASSKTTIHSCQNTEMSFITSAINPSSQCVQIPIPLHPSDGYDYLYVLYINYKNQPFM